MGSITCDIVTEQNKNKDREYGKRSL
jgi:hypothetical protein